MIYFPAHTHTHIYNMYTMCVLSYFYEKFLYNSNLLKNFLGMDLIVCLMEKGEKAKVIIPSKLAYGTVGL